MARKKRTAQQREIQDYRHDTATRKNNPPTGIAAQGKIQETPKQEYTYNPHLPPNLRSTPSGDADKLPEPLQKPKIIRLKNQNCHGDSTSGLMDDLVDFLLRKRLKL